MDCSFLTIKLRRMRRKYEVILIFIVHNISKQNPHIVATSIEDTININFAIISTIKTDVIPTYNNTIIALYIYNRR